MSDPAESDTLYTQYTAKVKEDLAALDMEREQLIARLAVVERDRELLARLNEVMSSDHSDVAKPSNAPTQKARKQRVQEQPPSAAAGTAGPGGVPVAADAVKGSRKAEPRAKRRGRKSVAKRTARKDATASEAAAGPSRRQMIGDYLTEVGEPRSSKEVWAELKRRHPDFSSSVPATRQALESLVALGQVERTTQGHSVYYGAVNSAGEGDRA
ncbi:hypothetical protein PUR49_11180 [Streptomyces sp. BE147]|uniref:hypothetical protein n=1 Tax=Streptomyces sp. BE147 TaxID=3002524 RepID=UPI002E78B283|nr:hypothetical protein [Streptomyces sp. BE147]MEE1737058.1 hypothetical protein [Streptomyces sp. BE147]